METQNYYIKEEASQTALVIGSKQNKWRKPEQCKTYSQLDFQE
jgi:hypothetical protein